MDLQKETHVSVQWFLSVYNHQAKIHPFSILLALENYKRGQGYQGKTKWEPTGTIVKAMDSAFYKSFMVCFIISHLLTDYQIYIK